MPALGFLGFGIEPTAAAEWGYDLNKALSDVTAGIWWTSVFPGTAIVLVVLGVTLIGESLNDLADPRLRATAALEGDHAGGRGRGDASRPREPKGWWTRYEPDGIRRGVRGPHPRSRYRHSPPTAVSSRRSTA